MISRLKAAMPPRIVITLVAIYCLVFSTAGFGMFSCKSNKDQMAAYAKDVADALEQAAPLVNQLLPAKAAVWATLIPKGRQLVEAVSASDKTTAAELVADIFPVIEDVVNSLTGNTQIRIALSLANIGLHFILNHLPAAPRAGRSGPLMAKLQQFKDEPVWGCQYHQERCGDLK